MDVKGLREKLSLGIEFIKTFWRVFSARSKKARALIISTEGKLFMKRSSFFTQSRNFLPKYLYKIGPMRLFLSRRSMIRINFYRYIIPIKEYSIFPNYFTSLQIYVHKCKLRNNLYWCHQNLKYFLLIYFSPNKK